MMKTQMILISFFLFVTLPAAGIAAEKASEPGTGDQRAACDAGCRENYQNNSAAMQACLRDCGAIGPASPQGAMAPAHEAAHTVQQSAGVKGSKSNSSERQASPPPPPPVPVETSNLNFSKSNINRVAQPPGAGAQPVEATTVKSSKSNSSEKVAQPTGAGAQPVEATTVKSSKSNSSERQTAPDTDEMPPVEPEGSPPEDG